MIYHFNKISLDTDLYKVHDTKGPVAIEPRVFDLLVYLVQHRDRVVTRDELLTSVWQQRVVSDTALSACLKAARKAVGDSGRVQSVIRTVHGRGYQFVASVSEAAQPDTAEVPKMVKENKPSMLIDAFQCLPEDEENTTFAEELRDQLLLRFSSRTGIRVIEASNNYDASLPGLPDYLLSGRIRRMASKYRVSLSMIWRTTNETVWAEGFTGDVAKPLIFSEEVTDTVDSALRLQLNAYDARRLADRDELQLDTSELLTKAAEYSYKASIGDLRHALALIDRALTISPNDAMALAMRAQGGVELAATVPDELHEEDDHTLSQMADRAIELNHQSDYAFYGRGSLKLLRLNDIQGALEDAKHCLDLSPAYVDGLELMGSSLICLEQADQAIDPLKRAVMLSKDSPYHAYYLERLALARFLSGDLNGALTDVDSALQLHSGAWTFHRLKSAILTRQGKEISAKESLERALQLINTPHKMVIELPLPPSYRQALENAATLSTET